MLGSTVVVTTGATLIYDNDQKGNANYPTSLIIKNPTGGATVYLGGATVNTTAGYRLEAADIISLDLVNDKLYGLVTASTQTVYTLRRET